MSNKDLVQKLYVIGKKLPVGSGDNEVTLEFFPLPIDDLQIMASLDSEGTDAIGSMPTIIAKSLRIDEEAAKKISSEYMADIMKHISTVNGIDKMSEDPQIKAMLKKKGLLKE